MLGACMLGACMLGAVERQGASSEVAVHGLLHQALRVLDLLLGGVETESRVALAGSHDGS